MQKLTPRRVREKARIWAAASPQAFDTTFHQTIDVWCRAIVYQPDSKPLLFDPYGRLSDFLGKCDPARRSKYEAIGKTRLDAAVRKVEALRRAQFEMESATGGGPAACSVARIYRGSQRTFQTAQRRLQHAAEQVRDLAGPNGLVALQVRRANMDAAAALNLPFSVANGTPPLAR